MNLPGTTLTLTAVAPQPIDARAMSNHSATIIWASRINTFDPKVLLVLPIDNPREPMISHAVPIGRRRWTGGVRRRLSGTMRRHLEARALGAGVWRCSC